MKKRSWIWKAICSLLVLTGISVSVGKNVEASAGPVMDVVTNEYSGKEQFTKVPSGTALVDIKSGVWDDLPAYSCNNLIVGENKDNIWCTYKLMWNNEKLFFSITAKDLTWNDDDMIEIAVRYKDQNWGYLFATMAPWVGAGQFGNGSMTFIDFEENEAENTRSIYFSANLKDKSMLREKESFLMNVNYYDYGERVNDEKSLICRLQSGVAASGDPTQFFPLVGTSTAESETPDNTLYDHVDEAYENDPTDEPNDNPPADNPPTDDGNGNGGNGGDEQSGGCGGEIGVASGLALGVTTLGIYMFYINKKNKSLEEN